MKKTKIICSIGPSSIDPDIMEQMVLNGMNVARVNFSHATEEEIKDVISSLKEVSKRTGRIVGLLYDTKGPEFRNGMLKDNVVKLVEGKKIRVVKKDVLGTEEMFSVNHPKAIESLKVGDFILLENGLMKIEVVSVEKDGVTCKVISGGTLGNKKSLNAPGVSLDIPFISEEDEKDIVYACKNGADFIALSFVNSKEDVLEVREILKREKKEKIKLISKIESKTGIDNLDEIIEVSDGIMVARGDLGVEVPMENLPIIQKQIINKCREKGKIVVVATEMLESMKNNIRPTRAEVSDVANAVLDGTDAVMLSGETTVGKYPIEAVKYMSQICLTTEGSLNSKIYKEKDNIDVTETIAKSVVEITKIIDVKAIAAATMSGYSARKISNLKPNSPIIALCASEKVARGLTLNYGVYSKIVKEYNNTDEIVEDAKKEASSLIPLKKKDIIIVTGGFPNNTQLKTTNFLKVEEVS